MKSLFMAGAAAAGLAVSAADATYTWPDDLSTASEIAVEYDTADPTKVKTLTATVAAGDAVTLVGGTIDFAADAVVKLAGYGRLVVSNALTGVNGLTVTNTAAKSGFLLYPTLLPTKSYATLYPGCDLDDITILYADNPRGGFSSSNSAQVHWPYHAKRETVDGVKTMTLQMQIQYPYLSALSGYVTKCVKIELRQSGSDVVGRTVSAYGCFDNYEGVDMERSYQMKPGSQTHGCLNVWPSAVYGSDTTSGNYGIAQLAAEWKGAARLSLRGSLTGLGGRLAIARGALVDTLGAALANGPAQLDVLGGFTAGDATGTANSAVAGARGGTLVYEATQAGSWTATLAKTNSMASSRDKGAIPDYAGHLVVKGYSAIGAYMTCDIQAQKVAPKDGSVDIYDGGVVNFMSGAGNHSNSSYQNDTATYYVYSGGVLRVTGNHALYRNGKIRLLGGTLEKRRDGSSSAVNMNLYCNTLLLADGAQVNGDPANPDMRLWMGNEGGRWNVRGTSPSCCNVPVQFVGTYTHTIDVADVTGDDRPDFAYTRTFGTQESGKGASVVKKTGEGTVLCKGDVDVAGGLNVTNGTWQLGASNLWKNNRALTLSGGTFSVSNNTSNAIGALTVEARGGTIELGEGATLAFPAPSGTWAGTVTIKGFRENAIRFGTDLSQVDKDRYRFRTADGRRLHLMDNGYLAPYGMMVTVQ